jgi:histidinol-phosphatase (PHP family)
LAFGPHWVADSQDLPYIPVVNSKQEIRRYFAGVVDGIASGLFAFVAHPDLIMASGRQWDADIEAGLKDVLQAAIDYNLPVEANGLGLARAKQVGKGGQLYPHNRFWELVATSGARVICNSDAHQSENTIAHAQLARDYVAQFGLEPIASIF